VERYSGEKSDLSSFGEEFSDDLTFVGKDSCDGGRFVILQGFNAWKIISEIKVG
jgi:hypothetical protein